MQTFSTIKELIRHLNKGEKLLGEMFGKRNTLAFRYDEAVEILTQDELKLLINYAVIRENGAFLEIDDIFLDFFKQIFRLSEEINVSIIHENIEHIKQNIIYYFNEVNQNRKYDYLRIVKNALRKVGIMTYQNVIDLGKKIDTTFKVEPNFKNKVSKLEYLDKKREDIELLINQTQNLLKDELLFFNTATDEELNKIITHLKIELINCQHNLIESRKQIIEYLNQIKYKSGIIDKLKKLKYLRDQLLIQSATDIESVLQQTNAVVFETRTFFSVKLSLEFLQTTDGGVYSIIEKVRKNAQSKIKAKVSLAAKIDASYFERQIEESQQINLEEVKNSFVASSNNLFDFVLSYRFLQDLSFDEKVNVYCRVISLFDKEIEITDKFATQQGIDYALVYPK